MTFRIIIIIIIIYSKVKTAKLKILIVTLLQSYNVTKNNKTSLSELKAAEIKGRKLSIKPLTYKR